MKLFIIRIETREIIQVVICGCLAINQHTVGSTERMLENMAERQVIKDLKAGEEEVFLIFSKKHSHMRFCLVEDNREINPI